MALTTSDFSIRTLLLVAAAAPLVGRCGVKITRLLIVYNCIVESMQRPAESAKLQQELAQLQADLPHILLSYQELLAYFVKLASNEAAELMTTGDGSMASDIDAAYRWACPVTVGEAPEKTCVYVQLLIRCGRVCQKARRRTQPLHSL